MRDYGDPLPDDLLVSGIVAAAVLALSFYVLTVRSIGSPLGSGLIPGIVVASIVQGHLVASSIFPGRSDLTGGERIAASAIAGLSSCLILGLLLWLSPWGLSADLLAVASSSLALISVAPAWGRRSALPRRMRLHMSHIGGRGHGGRGLRPSSWASRVASSRVALLVLGTLTLSAVALMHLAPDGPERPGGAVFSVLGPGGEPYSPGPMEPGEGSTALVRIWNRDPETTMYTLKLALDGKTAFSREIWLGQNQTWEHPVSITPPAPGTGQEVLFLLYRASDLATPYAEERASIDVIEPEVADPDAALADTQDNESPVISAAPGGASRASSGISASSKGSGRRPSRQAAVSTEEGAGDLPDEDVSQARNDIGAMVVVLDDEPAAGIYEPRDVEEETEEETEGVVEETVEEEAEEDRPEDEISEEPQYAPLPEPDPLSIDSLLPVGLDESIGKVVRASTDIGSVNGKTLDSASGPAQATASSSASSATSSAVHQEQESEPPTMKDDDGKAGSASVSPSGPSQGAGDGPSGKGEGAENAKSTDATSTSDQSAVTGSTNTQSTAGKTMIAQSASTQSTHAKPADDQSFEAQSTSKSTSPQIGSPQASDDADNDGGKAWGDLGSGGQASDKEEDSGIDREIDDLMDTRGFNPKEYDKSVKTKNINIVEVDKKTVAVLGKKGPDGGQGSKYRDVRSAN